MKQLRLTGFFLILALLPLSCQQQKSVSPYLPPEELYGDLFYAVQSGEIFPDSKTFVDCTPRSAPGAIREAYALLANPVDEQSLRAFVETHFFLPEITETYISDSLDILTHISRLWDRLSRPADAEATGTLIPLPYSYIVPGGRFREIYYWDSYFTLLGLYEEGRYDLVRNMVDNFTWLIEKFGHIPNGNRSYYLSRSQPPFYSLMVDLLASIDGDSVYLKYQASLEKEYTFWMAGFDSLSPDQSCLYRVVKLPDGSLLNRYWDNRNTPRAESYREDIATASEALKHDPDRKPEEVYRNLRAAAESGWDFSSRWLEMQADSSFPLYTIRTTEIVPVDLNALLYHLERVLAKSYRLKSYKELADFFEEKAQQRRKAIQTYCWNERAGLFMDYNFKEEKQTGIYSLAAAYPLFLQLADTDQAERIASRIKQSFLRPGGVICTLHYTGEQWDAPNGWAPLQWISIQGLRNYRKNILADTLQQRWMKCVEDEYYRSYKLLEKYNVDDLNAAGGGGEYPTQDGFGWTNGVYQKLSR